eukprot:scaffold83869_cov45-Cyclotella_meneghiniana.AAC.5
MDNILVTSSIASYIYACRRSGPQWKDIQAVGHRWAKRTCCHQQKLSDEDDTTTITRETNTPTIVCFCGEVFKMILPRLHVNSRV